MALVRALDSSTCSCWVTCMAPSMRVLYSAVTSWLVLDGGMRNGFYSFGLENGVLVGPCGCPNCCCGGLIKQLGLEIACRCVSVIEVVHLRCNSFNGRLEDSGCFAVLVCLEDSLDKAAIKYCFLNFLVKVPSSFVSSMMLAKRIS